ncbi:hypothetical protein Taro_039896 [Colocasia esculenta]|uniref:FCP1 homology domain-containing protein n=1 Tax=Colocasia esculenta TaxID=4460 RepID=A0A843WNL0_COLES|nr:hypothetical protein [Colocasia esculenta]
MVSKTRRVTPKRAPAAKSPSKRTPSLHGRRAGNRSPLKDIAAVPSFVAASIDRSLRTCRRRLIRVFARLVSLAACGGPPTPSAQRKCRKQGFLLLNTVVPGDLEEGKEAAKAAAEGKKEGPVATSPPPPEPGRRPLPPPASLGKKTLFLDLDETLVHSQPDVPPARYDFVVRPAIGGQLLTFYVAVRPGTQRLLAEAAKRFEVVVFTAGLREYASLVLAQLDPRGELISHGLYRDSCSEVGGKLTKDLAGLGRDLSRVVIVDDNPNSYVLQPENAMPVRPFVDDLNDREMWRVMEFLAVAEGFEDTREAIKSFLCPEKEKPREEEEEEEEKKEAAHPSEPIQEHPPSEPIQEVWVSCLI